MKMIGAVLLLLVLTISLAVPREPRAEADNEGTSCDVTLANGQIPPSERPSDDYYGNGVIFTTLWPNGVVRFERGGPGEMNSDGSLGMKWLWWRYVPTLSMQIEGHRLDAPAPPLVASIPDGYGGALQATGLTFPTEGCWEVTAHAGEASLSFVMLVVLSP